MTAKECSEVTFFMVGCQRCGTTWTDAALREHPQVYLPPRKQSYFFDRNYDKGIDWFMERFSGVEPHHLAVGEISTGYCLPDSVPLMAKHFPSVKLLMVMRNPIDRAYSNYQSRKSECGWKSFEQAIGTDPDLLERGQYADQIEAIFNYYPREQLMLLLYDDLHSDDRLYLKSVLDFIGVDSDVDSKLIGQRKNAAMFPTLRKVLNRLGLKQFVSFVSKSRIGDLIRRKRKNKGMAYQQANPKTREKLVQHFLPYNNRLSEILDRDLSHWNRV
ncbi:MAG: sulfotransferase [Phycisphaerales bacterium]|jgi:hypothetical protein|nr:sulfotransferase [Phycisphaerales bacterium]